MTNCQYNLGLNYQFQIHVQYMFNKKVKLKICNMKCLYIQLKIKIQWIIYYMVSRDLI